MTEVPEHLLRRSRERREALGLGGDGEGGSESSPAAPPPAAQAIGESEAPGAPASATPTAASADTAVESAASGGAVAVLEDAPPARPVPTRTKTPIWIMPVLVGLPIYAFIYAGAFGTRNTVVADTPENRGSVIFHGVGTCAGCHGANGEGGIGPKLAGGEAVKTFPSVADQIAWVHTGSAPFTGKKYGDPNRPGGQHGPSAGVMPPFGQDNGGQIKLTDAQIQDVVAYERSGL